VSACGEPRETFWNLNRCGPFSGAEVFLPAWRKGKPRPERRLIPAAW